MATATSAIASAANNVRKLIEDTTMSVAERQRSSPWLRRHRPRQPPISIGPVTRAALAHRLRRVLEVGCLPTDSDQEKVTKEVFVVMNLGGALAGVLWAVMYAALGKPA